MGRMKTLISICLLCVSLSIIKSNANSVGFSEAPELNPIVDLGVYILPGRNAWFLVEQCGIDRTDLNQYWRPTERQIRIIDKKINALLLSNNNKLEIKKLQKLYFGLTDGANLKQVFAFIYPETEKPITTEFGNDIFVCLDLKMRATFDLANFELKLLP